MADRKYVKLQTEDAFLHSIREKTANRFVLLVDVLGFSDLILSEEISKSQRIGLALNDAQKSANTSYPDPSASSGKPVFKVETALFSDTIIAWTARDSETDLFALVLAATKISENLLAEKIPFRGAIAKGEFVADKKNSIFLGKPLVHAHRLSEDLQFVGTVLHHSAEKLGDPKKLNLGGCFWAEVPTKCGRVYHHVVPPRISSLDREEMVHGIKAQFENLYSRSSGSKRIYVDNAIQVFSTFFDHLNEDSQNPG